MTFLCAITIVKHINTASIRNNNTKNTFFGLRSGFCLVFFFFFAMDYPAERERTEKPKGANKALPKDAQVIMSILKLNNIQEYDPRVINQLLEFTYRKCSRFGRNNAMKQTRTERLDLLTTTCICPTGYVSCLLDDAKVYANHAKKKSIETEDVKLAAHMILERSFTGPPPTEVGWPFSGPWLEHGPN